MGEAVYTSGHVAELFEMARHRLAYLIETRQLPGPSAQVPGRRLFTAADIDRIREALEQRPQLRSGRRGPGVTQEARPE